MQQSANTFLTFYVSPFKGPSAPGMIFERVLARRSIRAGPRRARFFTDVPGSLMPFSNPPTVQEWLRGWTLTYIPNEDEAERLATHLRDHLETTGLPDRPLSEDVRTGLERMLGTAEDPEAQSPRSVVESILSEDLRPAIAEAAAGPLAVQLLNRGQRTLDMDVEKEVPPALAQALRSLICPQITPDGLDRIREMYDRVGAKGMRLWLRKAPR